jgi:hypothetical protein
VELFLEGRVAGLTLHLPAPLDTRRGRFVGGFVGEFGSAGSAANHYHDLFRQRTGVDGLARLSQALARGAACTEQAASPGFAAMKERNRLVATQSDVVLAYTWDEGAAPAAGGTLHTWQTASQARRHHFSLHDFMTCAEASGEGHDPDESGEPRDCGHHLRCRAA